MVVGEYKNLRPEIECFLYILVVSLFASSAEPSQSTERFINFPVSPSINISFLPFHMPKSSEGEKNEITYDVKKSLKKFYELKQQRVRERGSRKANDKRS